MKNDNLKLKTNLRQRTYLYAIQIIQFTGSLEKNSTTNIISKQLLRSATSIGANIFEAQASSSRRDFINFFHHSLKSANETLFWLYLLRDGLQIQNSPLDTLITETKEIANILGASLLTLKKKR